MNADHVLGLIDAVAFVLLLIRYIDIVCDMIRSCAIG
jgi:hypothetical protein